MEAACYRRGRLILSVAVLLQMTDDIFLQGTPRLDVQILSLWQVESPLPAPLGCPSSSGIQPGWGMAARLASP